MFINNQINVYNSNQPTNQVAFEGCKKYLRVGNYCLNKMGDDITPKTVKKLPFILKKVLKIFTPKRIKELAEVNCYAANKIKTHFDNLYGKNKYTIINIGRSTASMAETMQHMGANVKLIPLSGLRRFLPNNIKNTAKYRNYLNSVGINRGIINRKSQHKYILFDYSYSGNSLEHTKEFFERDILKSKPQNLITVSANEVLGKDFSQNFQTLFSLNRFKNFSAVGKLNIKKLENCFSQSKPATMQEYQQSNMAKYLRKIFMFNVCETMKNKKFNNVCPKEKEALYNHKLCQKALRLRADREFKKMENFLGFKLDKDKI